MRGVFCRAILSAFILLSSQHSFADDRQISRNLDFDGDGGSDLVVYDGTTSIFTVRTSKSAKLRKYKVGQPGNLPAHGDFDGDGRADLASFNPSTGVWSLYLATGESKRTRFGIKRSVPVPGRYTGQSCTDLATYLPQTGEWRIRNCKTGEITARTFNVPGAVPVPADYDCDNITDLAAFDRTASKWKIKYSSNGAVAEFRFGLLGDIPMPADYEGVGCASPAIYRPTTNQFIARKPNGGGAKPVQWGLNSDIPATFDINGGGVDYIVYRAQEKNFYVKKGAAGVLQLSIADSLAKDGREGRAGFNFGSLQDLINAIINDNDAGDDDSDVSVSVESGDGGNFEPTFEEPVFGTDVPATTIAHPVTNYGMRYTRAKGDYRGANSSDFVVVNTNSFAKRWSILHQDGTTSSYNFGTVTDSAYIAADYDGDGATNPAFTRAREDGFLEWFIHTANGVKVSLYGIKGDKTVAGDFDCDGKADMAVGRDLGGFLYWYILMTSGAEVQGRQFGIATDTPFAADVNGDSCDELIVAQDVFGGLYWFSHQVLKNKTAVPVQWGLSGDELMTPMDFDGDGRDEYVVARDVLGGKVFFIRHNSDFQEAINFGLEGDVPLIGYFSGVNKAEVAVYRPGFGDAPSSFFVRRHNGVATQHVFGTGFQTIVRPDGLPGTRAAKNGVQCDIVTDFRDGARKGSLWKPVSENTGNPVILMPASYWRQTEEVNIFGANGFLTKARHRSCCGNGGRAHFDTSVPASRMAAVNPITVQFVLENGINECRLVPDARQRQD